MDWVSRRIAFTKNRLWSVDNISEEKTIDVGQQRRNTDASLLRKPRTKPSLQPPSRLDNERRASAPLPFQNRNSENVLERSFIGQQQNQIEDNGKKIIPHDVLSKKESLKINFSSKQMNKNEFIHQWQVQAMNLSETVCNEAEKLGLPIELVPWETKRNSTLIKVDSKLFPVDKIFVSEASKFFQELLETQELLDPGFVMIELVGYDAAEVYNALKLIYSHDYNDITDENVASFLLTSDEYKISRLRYQCESYLESSTTFNPYIAIQLAITYNLKDLLALKCNELSKIRGIETTKEFEALDISIQNEIMRYCLKRYRKASKLLSQIDVHLCVHHCEVHRNNDCCLRAATYNTVEDRTFLIKMETPEKIIAERFENKYDASLKRNSWTYEGVKSLSLDE